MEKAVIPTVRITLRLPADLHAALKEAAPENERVLNSEIVYRLRQSFKSDPAEAQIPSAPVPPSPSNTSVAE